MHCLSEAELFDSLLGCAFVQMLINSYIFVSYVVSYENQRKFVALQIKSNVLYLKK